MSGQSLESERQAILERMQMRRESYRRALTGGGDLDRLPAEPVATRSLAHSQQLHPTHRPVPTRFPRSTLMRVLIDHPVLCALGVAAIVAIGPRRLARTVSTGATALGTLAGNQSNVDLLSKVLSIAGTYVQGRTNDRHPHS